MSPTIHRTPISYRCEAGAATQIIGPSRKWAGLAENGRIAEDFPGADERNVVKQRRSASLIVLAGMAALAIGAEARGSAVPFSYSAQDRSVSANSSTTGFARGGTSSAPLTNRQSESQQANGYGDFSGNVAADSSIGPQSAGASASAMQQSTLGGTGFSASGSVVADSVLGTGGPANSTGSSVFQITFDVSQAESYVLTANLGAMINPAEPDAATASITLTSTETGNNIIAPITALSDHTIDGILKAGTYSFKLDTQVASEGENYDSINYSISLTDGPVVASAADGINQVGPSAVPLPSSGLTALVMLCAWGLAGWLRRLIRASML
jgi:hypothetical protein